MVCLFYYKAIQLVKLLQVDLYQIIVNKELQLIETDQNKIKSQFESLKNWFCLT